MRKLWIVGFILTLVLASGTLAGEGHDPMAEMANCHVCKVMVPHMGELMPVMKTDIIAMDNGLAMLTTITDSEKMGIYHDTCDAMHATGAETTEFTAEEAESKLCPACYKMWDIMASGGHLSSGKTADGHLMVLSSEDEEVQKKIAALRVEYETMMGG